ncbi:GspH/FimT family pseudopilin [Undibacterium sp. Xuan67W]|uniref:GspH/FimT family pseudopilin n=1 Tax=Undibacterium sp. Xuan67W TaxID=3413057 RepID=UPI003BF2EB51
MQVSPCFRLRNQAGFTLLELLVVLVIAGIMLGAVSFNAMQSSHQRLQTDAQRIAVLLQLAREEAIVRNRPIAFEADQNQYHFLVRNELIWEVLRDVDMLREREFVMSPVRLTISPATNIDNANLRIIFGREPIDKPFVLSMSSGEDQVLIRADGIGHFVVE